MAWSKTYDFEMTFGQETDTLDCEGVVTKTMTTDLVTQDALEQLMPEFQGEQNQIPPQYSAKKLTENVLMIMREVGKPLRLKLQKLQYIVLI